MRFLGIDYGTKKVGLSVSDGKLAEPLKVIRYDNAKSLLRKVEQVVQVEKIQKVIIGVSEGEMAEETKKFISTLSSSLFPISCIPFDETLTSKDAINFAISAGVPKQKRRKNEDAYAATIMLQNYLDSLT